MLWLSIIDGGDPSHPNSTGLADPDTPYLFSIQIADAGGLTHGPAGNSPDVLLKAVEAKHFSQYDFLIEGVEEKYYFQLLFRSARLCSVDALTIRREQCAVYDAPYSDVGIESPQQPLFTVVPQAGGDAPMVLDFAIKQKTDVSVSLYLDAVVISFDRFNIAKRYRVAEAVEAGADENGLLAALIFRDHLADYIRSRVK